MTHGLHPPHLLLKALLLSVMAGSLLLPNAAEARLWGDAEFGYASLDTTINGEKRTKDSLYQRYSLLYGSGGRLGGGVAAYAYAVGYEWGSVDYSGNSSAVQSGHLLYSGDFTYEPRNVPVSLKLFSMDKSRMMFLSEGMTTKSLEYPVTGGEILPSGMPSSILGGTRTVTGGQLKLGSSRYIAPKYAFMKELPFTVIEYREDTVEDLKSITPQHLRNRNFSLALKASRVWFQYGFIDSKDYIGSSNNRAGGSSDSSWREDRYQIGTVDNTQTREWVDLTNWIKLSADGEFVKYSDQMSNIVPKESYRLSLFGIATRQEWSARSFNRLERVVSGYGDTRIISNSTDIPLYVSGTFGTDTSWDFSAQTRDQQDFNPSLRTATSISNLSTSFRAQTFKRSPFTLAPSFTFDQTRYTGESRSNYTARIETASTRRYSDNVSLFAAYDFKYLTEEKQNAAVTNRLENYLTGQVAWRLTERLRVEVEENLTYSSGNTTIDKVTDSSGKPLDITERSSLENSYFRSLSKAKIAWNPTGRLRTAATVTVDILSPSPGDMDTIITFGQTIDYNLMDYKISSDLRHVTRMTGAATSSELYASANASYAVKKNLEMSMRGNYTQIDSGNYRSSSGELLQRVQYHIDRNKFGGGKLLEFTEEGSYLKGGNGWGYTGTYSTIRRVTLLASYFPYKNLYIGATSRYSLLDPGNVTEWFGTSIIGLNSPKLQASLEYGYGKRKGDADNRLESKFSANIKKQF